MIPERRLSLPEFTAMLALLFASIAFSIDAMLPALPQIAAELTPDAVNRAQLILTAFVLGMGVGTFFAGPISDATGRKVAITGGFVLYLAGSALSMTATSIEMLLAARFLQGLGAAGPRIAGLALVRDLYAGREMARVTSLVMMVFILVPAVAPSIGQVIQSFAGWRGVFGAFIVFGLVGTAWVNIRQEETLPPERRRPLRVVPMREAAREVLADPQVRLYTAVLSLGFGQMFALLSAAQQLFDETYGRGESFPLWFALMAILSGTGSVLNARFVVRLGMRRIATWAYAGQTIMSIAMLTFASFGTLVFPAFFIWAVSVFFMAGITFGNLNALALEKMGHIAGMATSVVSAIATIAAVAIAVPVGLAYNGTAVPILIGTLVCSAVAWMLMRRTTEAS
ncbi:multidrug effflux MFS transporter [Ostreiculturibacter nitratireducens]|uniref:multidrug effflux MFS transporter n=1 Tax=Ostreiculturibacter nitratireducens TaxID=3075226 RepID=UPI0031B5E9DB